MLHLKDIINETYIPKAGDEKRFMEKHVVSVFKNIYSTEEYDALFKGSKIKMVDRPSERHGYNPKTDVDVYENFEENQEINEMCGMSSEPDVKNCISDPTYSNTGSFANLAKQAYNYNIKHDCKYKLGHIMQAAAYTANDLNLRLSEPLYIVVNKLDSYPDSVNKENLPLKGGVGVLSKLTHTEADKKVCKLFDAHLKNCTKKNTVLDFSSNQELNESLESKAFEGIYEFQNILTEMYHKHISNGIEYAAEKNALPVSCVLALLHCYNMQCHAPNELNYLCQINHDYHVGMRKSELCRVCGVGKRKPMTAIAKKMFKNKEVNEENIDKIVNYELNRKRILEDAMCDLLNNTPRGNE